MLRPRVLRLLLGVTIAVVAVLPAVADDEAACDQAPGSRFSWVERAFCDLPTHGPDKANGVIIWNHGISGTTEAWRAPVPPVFRLLQVRGWDVLVIKRNNLGETNVDQSLYRAVQWTVEEIRRRRERGYRKIVLAGQSFGGYITLETAERSREVFAVFAMAPGVRSSSASGRLDPSVTDRILGRLKTERVGVVFPKNDALFNYAIRGEMASRILAARRSPYLLIDETGGISGHAGATGGKFALRYGLCVNEFLSAVGLPAERFVCPDVDESTVVHELLLSMRPAPRFLEDPAALPPGLGPLAGRWYTTMDDALLAFGLVEGDGGAPRALYRWATSRIGGLVYEATAADGQVTLALPNKARVTIAPNAGRPTLTWRSADGATVVTAPLLKLRDSR